MPVVLTEEKTKTVTQVYVFTDSVVLEDPVTMEKLSELLHQRGIASAWFWSEKKGRWLNENDFPVRDDILVVTPVDKGA